MVKKFIKATWVIITIIDATKTPLNNASPYISTLTGDSSNINDSPFFNIASDFEEYRGGVCSWMPYGDILCKGGNNNEHHFEGTLDLGLYSNPVMTLDYTFTNGGSATSMFYIDCGGEYEILLDINMTKPFRCNAYDNTPDMTYDYATVSLPELCKNNNNVKLRWEFTCLDGNSCLWFAFKNILIVDTTDLDGVNGCLTSTIEPTQNTFSPTIIPSIATKLPTISPSIVIPTEYPTVTPSLIPSNSPTQEPTINPTVNPTVIPTYIPSQSPTNIPTNIPTTTPTKLTNKPTYITIKPSNAPTTNPTPLPTNMPTTSDPLLIKEENVAISKVLKIRMVNVYTFMLLYTMIAIFIIFRTFYYIYSNKKLIKSKKEHKMARMHQNGIPIDMSQTNQTNVTSQQHCKYPETSTKINIV